MPLVSHTNCNSLQSYLYYNKYISIIVLVVINSQLTRSTHEEPFALYFHSALGMGKLTLMIKFQNLRYN